LDIARQLPLPLHGPGLDWDRASGRLNGVYAQAPRLTLDESSRCVFFSDLHRGDRSRADGFTPNSELFLRVLEQYYGQGYSYFEVGDGDELWKNRSIVTVERSHPAVFALLRQLHRENRLHLVLGNHDIAASLQTACDKAGLSLVEGLVLHHVPSSRDLLVVHGHQADFYSDALYLLARWGVRHVWRPLQMLGARKRRRASSEPDPGPQYTDDHLSANKARIERRLMAWVRLTGIALLCGHTHRPVFPETGGLPYYNTGTGVRPGCLTGLEIRDDHIMLVRWAGHVGQRPQRQMLCRPMRLSLAL